jgi:hypothetical protein
MSDLTQMHRDLLAAIPDVDSNHGIRALIKQHAPTFVDGHVTCTRCGIDAPCPTWKSIRDHHLNTVGDEFDRRALVVFNGTRRRRDGITGRLAPISGSDRIDIATEAARLRAAAQPDRTPRCPRFDLPVDGCDHCRTL